MIPKSRADITAPWLTDVLQRAGVLDGAVVESSHLAPVGVGVGIMGELYRASLTFDGDAPGAPSSVIVKITSPFEANRVQGVALGLYEAEVRFYRELAAATPLRVPRCYHAELEPSTFEFVLVLEDLGHCASPDQLVGLSQRQAEVATQALADLHGRFWRRTDTIDWIPSVVHERIKAFAGTWPELWVSFSSRFADWLPEGALAAGERIKDHYWELMCRLGDRPWTLLHQDFRCDNLLYASPDGQEDVVVIDWQTIGRGPGAYDLAYLLGGSLAIDDRRRHEEHLVRAYHERLLAHGVQDYAFDELWTDYRLCHLVNTSVAVITGGTMDLANERGRQLVGTLGQRHFTAVVDLRSTDLIDG